MKQPARKISICSSKKKLERIIPVRLNAELWNQFGSTVDKFMGVRLVSKHTSRSSIIRDLIEGWIIETSAFIARQEATELVYNHGRQDFEGGGSK